MSRTRTLVTIATERDWVNGRESILRNIITKDEMYTLGPYDRGKWSAQGYANLLGRHVFVSIESENGLICIPIFPVDDEESDYCEEERGEEDWYNDKEDKPEYKPCDRRHADYVEEMRKEGRWQGDREHVKYPWKRSE